MHGGGNYSCASKSILPSSFVTVALAPAEWVSLCPPAAADMYGARSLLGISAFAGTKTVLGIAMRLHTSIPLILGAAALLACDQSGAFTLAGLGTTAAGNAALVISPNKVTLSVGGAAQLSTNAPLNLQTQVQWSSLESTIVTVSPSGLINAVGPGTATVTARFATDTTNVGSATITVTGTTTP